MREFQILDFKFQIEKIPPAGRHLCAGGIALVPALFIGFWLGADGRDMGSPLDIGSVVLRCLVCAAPPALLAIFAPRLWLLPWVIYCCGYWAGYTFLEGMFTNHQMQHSEFIWILLTSFCLPGWIAMLRLHFALGRKNPATA